MVLTMPAVVAPAALRFLAAALASAAASVVLVASLKTFVPLRAKLAAAAAASEISEAVFPAIALITPEASAVATLLSFLLAGIAANAKFKISPATGAFPKAAC